MYQFFTEDIFGLSAEMANWIVTGVLTLVVLIILYFLYRLISRPRLASGRRSKQARLAITDAAAVDERRRLVLVRRDDVEHLVMIGGAADIVIESNIRKNAPARPMAAQTKAQAQPQSHPVVQTQAQPQVQPAAPTPAPPPAPAAVAPPASQPATPAPSVQASAPSVAPAVAAVGTTVAAATTVATDAAASTKSAVESASELIADRSKTSVGDDMDALLDEITTDK